MATPYTADAPIQPLGLQGPGTVPVPNIETRTEDQYFQDVNTPTGLKPITPGAGAPAPVDPFAGFADAPASFDQFQDAPDQFAHFKTADDLDVKTTDELNADRKGFDPVAYFASNPDAASNPAKLQKLLDVYRKRREEGLTASGVISAAVKETPGLVGNILGGVKRLGERAIDVTVQPVANVVLGTLTGDLFDEQKRNALFNETRKVVKKGVAEAAAGSESATVGLVDLTRTGARKLEPIDLSGGLVEPPKPKTDQQLLSEISDDASFRQNAEDILKGGGEAAKNFGLDKETLGKQGISLDEEAIKQLSLVDPITMVATGGAFKLIGTAGKILGTARTLEGAKLIAEKLTDIAKYSAGKTVQGAGKALGVTGQFLKGSGTSLATVAGVSSAVTGGGIPTSLIVSGGVKLAGRTARAVGPVIEHAGKAIAGEVPVSAALQKVLDYSVKPASAAAGTVIKGAATGIAAAAPFAVAADSDEQAGALLGAGAAIGAAHGAGAGAFRVVKNAAAREYFGQNRPVLPDVLSPGYGDPALDALHETQMQKLSTQDASEVNNFREILRPLGKKILAVDVPTFRQKIMETMPDATPEQLDIFQNHNAFFDSKDTVYLNTDTTGLQHDAGHLFDALLTPEKRTELRTAVSDTFGQKSINDFKALYEKRLGNKISDAAALDEFIAEQFASLFNNVPVTELNAPKSLLSKFIDTVAEGAEILGVDIGAGKTTPNLNAPVSVGIRKLFQNAAGEVTRRNVEGAPPSNVTPLPPTPPPAPPGTAPVAPPTNVVPLVPPPSNVVPLTPPAPAPTAPAGRNIRVTPEQVAAFKRSASPGVRALADARAKETGVDYARGEAKKNDGSPTSQVIEKISDSMESGAPVVGIEHLGITSVGTPEGPIGATLRKAEQAGGYAALNAAQLDVRQNAPPEIVSQHSKNFVPVRWTDQGGSPTLIAMSLDKVISNILRIAADKTIQDLIPYPVENGKLTPEGWQQVVADAQAYSENQANGRKGDGGRLEVPEAGLSIPAENPAYTPQPLTPERANFQNLVQGLAPPQTNRSPKGEIPGNVKGQLLAEANKRPVEIPANIPTKHAGKQAFVEFPPRVIQETNPLRNEMARRGVRVRDLLEVTERIRAKDIVSAEPKPDINYKAPVTDIIRGGFLPAPTEFRQKNLGGKTVEEFSDYVLNASPAEFKAATENMTGGLTGGAWNFGLGLKNAADVGVLKSFQERLSSAAKSAMQSGDFDAAYSAVSKGQFFREAYEAATGTGSAGAAFKRGAAGMESAKPPFPITETTTGTTSAAGPGTTTEAAKFQPAEQLRPEDQPPELRVVPTPAAAGGTPPIEPPARTVIPPPVAAGRFQPAEQLNPDQTPELKVVPAAAATPPVEPPGRGMIPPPVAAKEDKESAKFQPKASVEIQDLAKKYADDNGIPYAPTTGYAEIKPDLSKRLAEFYDKAKSDPTNPEVAASYAALIKETEDQGKAILAAGYKIEPWTGAGEPYKDSASAIADVRDNKHLYFLKTSENFGTGESTVGNPMLAESNLVPGQTVNDVFRWVHDFFGHSKEGFQFGPRGEFNAWRAHSEMYSPEAQGALAGETLAQNSWVNFGPHLEGRDIPLKDRPFAEQKNIVVPKDLIAEAGSFLPRTEAGRKLEEKGYEIVATGEMGTRKVTILDKDKNAIAQITSIQLSPKKAEIAFVNKKPGAPAGLGEVLYREVGAQLRDDGVKSLGGHVIAPEPLAIRKKIFGGFKKLTINGEPATYEQALRSTEQPDNGSRYVAAVGPVNEITAATKFLPRDAQGRPLDKNGDIDYAKWQAESVAANNKRKAEPIAEAKQTGPVTEELGNATGWILPNKKFIPLDTAFHEQYLAENADTLNKKFGTEFSGVSSTDDRLEALNAGFIRLRNQGGRLSVEANSDKWSSLKSRVLSTLQDREGKVDSLSVSLLNDKGQQVDSASAVRLHEMGSGERMTAIEDAINSVRSSGPKFLPAEGGLPGIGIQTKEEAGRAKAARRISTVKKNNPEAVTPQYARDENGDVIVTSDGTPKPLTLDYNFIDSPLAKEAAKGLKGVKREEAAAVALGDELAKVYRQVEKNPDIKAGAKWYSTARTRLKGVFGNDSKFFAELLGATSARTPVDINYRFALDAYNQFKAGAYDETLAKYREGKQAWDAQDLGKFPGGEDATRGQFLDWWVGEHDLGVTQSNGKKFGMNSRAVLRVLDGSWASEVQGPKTPNFAGNLTGATFEATIDVWAGRTLNRLANEGRKDRWRILPENETGISDADFYLGQAAYRAASKKLGIKPDALQAVLWFAEKNHWEQKGWTRGAGAAKSDFNVLLADTERTPSGKLQMKQAQQELTLEKGNFLPGENPKYIADENRAFIGDWGDFGPKLIDSYYIAPADLKRRSPMTSPKKWLDKGFDRLAVIGNGSHHDSRYEPYALKKGANPSLTEVDGVFPMTPDGVKEAFNYAKKYELQAYEAYYGGPEND